MQSDFIHILVYRKKSILEQFVDKSILLRCNYLASIYNFEIDSVNTSKLTFDIDYPKEKRVGGARKVIQVKNYHLHHDICT